METPYGTVAVAVALFGVASCSTSQPHEGVTTIDTTPNVAASSTRDEVTEEKPRTTCQGALDDVILDYTKLIDRIERNPDIVKQDRFQTMYLALSLRRTLAETCEQRSAEASGRFLAFLSDQVTVRPPGEARQFSLGFLREACPLFQDAYGTSDQASEACDGSSPASSTPSPQLRGPMR